MAILLILMKPAIIFMGLNTARQLDGETEINIPSFGK